MDLRDWKANLSLNGRSWRSMTWALLLSGVALVYVAAVALLVVRARQQPAPAATQAVESYPVALVSTQELVGKILFRSDRDGGGLFVVDPGGQDVQPVYDTQVYLSALSLDLFSPDGEHNVYTTQGMRDDEIYLRDMRSGWVEQLTDHPGQDRAPALSPDGSQVAYVSTMNDVNELRVMDVDTRQDRGLVVDEITPGDHPSWSPDGQQLVYVLDQQLWVRDVDGGNARRLSDGRAGDWDPVWVKPPFLAAPTPDPREATLMVDAAVSDCTEDGQAALNVLAWDATGGTDLITHMVIEVDGFEFYDSGEVSVERLKQSLQITITGPEDTSLAPPEVVVKVWDRVQYKDTPYLMSMEAVCRTVRPVPEQVTWVLPSTAVPQTSFAISGPTPTAIPESMFRDKILFKSDRDGNEALYMMNPDGSGRVRVQENNTAIFQYNEMMKSQTISPDGQMVVYTDYAEDGDRELYILNLHSGWIWQLTDRTGEDYGAVWSPDGKRIVFVAAEGAKTRLFLYDVDGRQMSGITQSSWEQDTSPTWSPDGRRIAFSSNRVTTWKQIWVIGEDGRGLTNISNSTDNQWDPVWIAEPVPLSQCTYCN
ncbi:MAG: hypothetical protein GYA17_19095 [Chloroflexi bacterium]|nr:DPP IV N-terminal domain-containing protein [Anaerolineaceae bacterium]NMB90474.1 hypothetical protein [Chloroflexota bacterium]